MKNINPIKDILQEFMKKRKEYKEKITAKYNSNDDHSLVNHTTKDAVSDMSDEKLIECFINVCPKIYTNETIDRFTSMNEYKGYIEDEFIKRKLPTRIFKDEILKSVFDDESMRKDININYFTSILVPPDKLDLMKITDLILTYRKIQLIPDDYSKLYIENRSYAILKQYGKCIEKECKNRNII